MREVLAAGIAIIVCGSVSSPAQIAAPDLSQSTMEQLTQMEISVSSVSRKEESLFHTPAAAYVLTREDIAHSAASSVPELLRSVPGLQVAQISASTWAVSARGFNSAFANKLLVLIDGRTVYSEIYSGEHWDEIDLPLSEIERIEVIRGPGAVVWGTNAVNGVVNIITRSARSVSSPVLSGEISRIDDKALVQQGGTLGNRAQYREFLSYLDRKPLENSDGSTAFDGEHIYRAGARLDWRKDSETHLSFLGDVYGGPLRQQLLPALFPSIQNGGQEHDFIVGGFGLMRLAHEATRNSYELQVYASDATRHELSAKTETVTEDVDAVDHFHAGERLDLVGGGEVRITQDSSQAPVPVITKPFFLNYLVDGFLQGEATLVPGKLSATFGSKIQDGTLAGFQIQPSARLSWTIDPSQFLWAAVSRGAAAPALQDKDLRVGFVLGTSNGLPVLGVITGNPAFKPETVLASEIGYRKHLTSTLALDVAAYANNTQRLQSLTAGTPSVITTPSPAVSIPLLYGNGYSATSQGVEASLEWHPVDKLQLGGNYTWLEAQVTQKAPGTVNITDGFNSPRNTFAGTGRWAFASAWNLQGMLYRVSSITPNSSISIVPNTGTETTTRIAGYTRLDLGLERRVRSHLQLAAGGTNLTSARHLEFGGFTTFLTPLYVPRSLFVRASWSF